MFVDFTGITVRVISLVLGCKCLSASQPNIFGVLYLGFSIPSLSR